MCREPFNALNVSWGKGGGLKTEQFRWIVCTVQPIDAEISVYGNWWSVIAAVTGLYSQ